MASTTTNYGFDVPTSSDLVKNGATQIALLGQDIDTFLFRPFTTQPVLNSAMQVWQRGTSMAGSATAFAGDRWQAYRAVAGSTYSRQVTNDTTNLPNIQYCTRVQRDSGNSSTTGNFLIQNFESANSIPFAGKQVTLSFYARAGANYSAAAGAMEYNVATGTGTDQNLITGFTGRANPILGNATLTTTWQRFTATATLAATATQIAIAFDATWVGTASTNDYFEVTGVMLEVGNQASPFRTYAATIQGEYSACQRYYQRITAGQNFYRFGLGTNVSATQAGIVVSFKTSMRTTPTFTASGNFDTVEGTTSRGTNAPTLSSDGNNTESAFIFTSIASATTGYSVQLRSSNNVNSYIDFSAEL